MSLCVCVYTTYIYIYILSIQVVWELFPLWTIVNSAAMSIFQVFWIYNENRRCWVI